jgi:hypothetical protein
MSPEAMPCTPSAVHTYRKYWLLMEQAVIIMSENNNYHYQIRKGEIMMKMYHGTQ